MSKLVTDCNGKLVVDCNGKLLVGCPPKSLCDEYTSSGGSLALDIVLSGSATGCTDCFDVVGPSSYIGLKNFAVGTIAGTSYNQSEGFASSGISGSCSGEAGEDEWGGLASCANAVNWQNDTDYLVLGWFIDGTDFVLQLVSSPLYWATEKSFLIAESRTPCSQAVEGVYNFGTYGCGATGRIDRSGGFYEQDSWFVTSAVSLTATVSVHA